jgi:hypothetical protein
MKTVFLLLLLFLVLGLFARQYNGWVRLLVSGVVVGMILFISFT